MFEASIPSAPTREARQRAERVADDQRHRRDRLDVGQRHEGVAPQRRDRRQRRHDGHHSRRGTGSARRPASPPAARGPTSVKEARGQLMPANLRAGGRLGCRALGEQLGALLGQQRAPGAAEDASGLGGEVPAAGEQLGARGRRRSRARRRAAPRARRRRGELGVVRGDDHRLAARGAAAQLLGELRLGVAVHAARGLVEREHRRRLAPPSVTIASARRWRSPPERSRGLRSACSARPAARSARGRGLARDALVQEVVAGVLQQQRDPPAALDPPAGGLQQPGGVAQQRGLAGAVASHQRDALAGLHRRRSAPRRIAGPRWSSCQTPRSRAPARRHRCRPCRARCPCCMSGRAVGARLSAAIAIGPLDDSRPSRAQRGARLLDPDRRRVQIPASANSRAPGVCSAGASLAGPRQERFRDRRRARGARRRSAITRSASGRQRSRRCSASRIVDVPLLVEAAQQPDQLVAGDRVELRGGLVEQQHAAAGRRARRRARRAASRRRRASCGRAVEQVVDAERERHLLDPARDRGRRVPAALQRERELGAHGAHHQLGLGVLEERAGERPQAARVRARACRARRAAHAPRSDPPWKCGARPHAARSSVDLPCPESPASRQNSPAATSKLTSSSAGRAASG